MRDIAVVFAATLNVIEPLPEPLVAPVRVIHLLPLAAVHAHPAVVVMPNEPLPPEAAMDIESGASAYVQDTDAVACVIVTVCPATDTVPVRGEATVFGATMKVTVALPYPALAPERVIHPTFVDVLQAHAGSVMIVDEAVPPASGIE